MGAKQRQRQAKRKKDLRKKKEGQAPDDRASASKQSFASYTQDQRVLVVGALALPDAACCSRAHTGDGDFTFSRALVRHRGTGAGVLATAYDSEKVCLTKYKKFALCKEAIERAGGEVECSVSVGTGGDQG